MPDADPRALRPIAAAVALAVGVQAAFDAYTGLSLEDALITFRFAENLATGGGYAFWAGQPVQGTTTPLFTLLLAAVGVALGPRAVWPAADVINLFAVAAVGALSADHLRRRGLAPAWAAFGALVVTIGPKFLVAGAGGMETTVVIALMAASLWAAERRRTYLAAVLAASLVLTRLDGLAWAGLLWLWLLREDPRRAVVGAALGAAVLAPWVAYATWAFGTPIPMSILAKDAIRPLEYAYRLGDPASLAAWGRWAVPRWAEVTGGLPPGLLLTGAGAVGAVRGRDIGVVLAAHAIAFPALFYVEHGPYFGWYLLPVAWGAGLLGVRGLAAIAARWPRAGAPLAGSALLACVATSAVQAARYREAQENEVGLRRAVGEWLADHTAPDAVVAMEAIGYQGYFAHRRVIDIAGLVSPEVVAVATSPYDPAATFRRIRLDLRPDAVVLRSYEVEQDQHFHGGPLFVDAADRAAFLATFEPAVEIVAPHEAAAGRLGRVTVWVRSAPPR